MLWQHRKGGVYRIIGFTVIEDGWKPAVIYSPVDSTGTCVRPCYEFFDGRFTPLADTISQPPGEPEDYFEPSAYDTGHIDSVG
jgi:hypothetical protein